MRAATSADGRSVRRLSGGRFGGLVVTSALRDHRYQRLLLGRNSVATAGYSLHTTGYALDIARTYRSRRQAAAFDALERLQSHGVIEWIREPGAIHIAVLPRAPRAALPTQAGRREAHPKRQVRPVKAKTDRLRANKPPHATPHAGPRAKAEPEGLFSALARVFASFRL